MALVRKVQHLTLWDESLRFGVANVRTTLPFKKGAFTVIFAPTDSTPTEPTLTGEFGELQALHLVSLLLPSALSLSIFYNLCVFFNNIIHYIL